MTRKITLMRGLKAKIPRLNVAEMGFATDTEQAYIGGASGNIELAKQQEVNSLTTALADTTELNAQRSFFQLQKDHTITKNKSPLYRINGDRNITFLFPTSDKEYIHYRYQKDPNDDFIKKRETAIYKEEISGSTLRANYTEVVGGSMVGTATSNHYTTTVGTVLTRTFYADGIDMLHLHDLRGGLWKVSVDGVFVKNISTHTNAIQESEKLTIAGFTMARREIVRGLVLGNHTVKLEFLGDDPANIATPSPARGWIASNATSGTAAMESFYAIESTGISYTEKVRLTNDASNEEFALSVRPAGSTTSSRWFPEHSGIGTTFVGTTGKQKIIVDGVEILDFTPTHFKEFNEARIVQVLEMKHPEDLSVRAMLYKTDTIRDGFCVNSGTVKFLLPTQIVAGYVNMLPASTAFGKILTTSLNRNYPSTAVDGSETDLMEPLKSYEYVFTSSLEQYNDYFVGVKFGDPLTTFRLNEENKARVWVNHRADNIQKLYPQIFDYDTVQAGGSYSFTGTFFAGKVDNAKELIAG